jgi:hypothetical protein
MRFIAAPWLGVLEDGAWLRHAAHANAMAQRLARALTGLPGVRLLAMRSRRSTRKAGASTRSSAKPACASCARGTRRPKPSTVSLPTCAPCWRWHR